MNKNNFFFYRTLLWNNLDAVEDMEETFDYVISADW